MRFVHLCSLAWHDLSAAKSRAFVSAAGIGLGVAVLATVLGLGLGARQVILDGVVQRLPVDTIEVLPRTLDLGVFALSKAALFGADEDFDSPTVEKLAAIEGVARAFPKLQVNLPLGAKGGARFFGRPLYTDLFMIGVPTELLQPEVGRAFADGGDTVAVVISNQIIEIYNTSVAPALGTPQLTAQTLTGFEFDIVIGRSLMLGKRGASRTGVERARIVGASAMAMRLGATVPLDTARRLLAQYGDGHPPDRYASVLLKAKSAADVPRIANRVEAMGFSVDNTAEKTRDLITAATALASTVGLLVLLLAALNIAHSFFASLSERRRELAILRALGARRIDLVTMVLIEASCLGLLGGLAGIIVAQILAAAIDFGAATFLPNFPFKPESFFSFPPGVLGLGLLVAVAAAVIGAAWPAANAARSDVSLGLAI